MSKKRRSNVTGLNSANSSPRSAEVEKSGNAASGKNGMWTTLRKPSNWWIFALIALLSLGALGAGLKYLEEDAQREQAKSTKDRSMFSSVNPFVTASPTPTLSKEFLYASSRLLSVIDKNSTEAPPADLAVWRPSSGWWFVMGQTGSQETYYPWGMNGDKPVPGDYDGDGKTDFSVFRPSNNIWYIVYSSTGGNNSYPFGSSGDLPAQADFDGDGKTDAAVFRPSTGYWHILGSTVGYYTLPFGSSGDLPAVADYDGDGRADCAVWRPSDRNFYSLSSSNLSTHTITTGISSGTYDWRTVSGDYDGDGKADYGAYDRTAANWYIYQSTTATLVTTQWQSGGDTEVPNDYDGDGKTDIASWRDANGDWYIRQSGSSGSLRQVHWGTTGDIPVPAFYRR